MIGTDLSSLYVAHMAASSAAADAEAARTLMERFSVPEAAPANVEPKPAAKPSNQIDMSSGYAGTSAYLLSKGGKVVQPQEFEAIANDAVSTAGAVAKDVGKGVIETPRAVIGGLRDLFQHGVLDWGQWFEERMPLGGIRINGDGIEMVDSGALAADWAKNGPPQLPDPGLPSSVTGNIVRSATRFLSGFVPVFGKLKAVGLGNVGSAAGASFLTDFATADPNGARLSDLWREAGLPQNVLTDYLASDPADGEIEKRFKNAVESMGLGVLGDGIFKAARVGRVASAAIEAEASVAAGTKGGMKRAPALPVPEPKLTAAELDAPIGEASGPALVAADKLTAAAAATETGVPHAVAARGLTKATDAGGNEIYLNFARMDSPDSIKKVIGQMADAFAGDLDEARRGVMTFDETKALAEDMGYSVDDLLNRTKGQPLNAETAVAARKLLAASAEKLAALAEKAAGPTASDVDLFAFRKMLATHQAIQSEVIGARTETARALASWRIAVGSDAERVSAVTQALDTFGGASTAKELAQRIAALKAHNALTPQAVSRIARAGFLSRTADAISEVYTMSLLTSPVTHEVNFLSGFSTAMGRVAERAAAGMARTDDVASTEWLAMLNAFVTGQKKALRLGWEAMKSGESGVSIGSKVEAPPRSISGQAFGLENTPGGKALDYIGAVFGIPGRLLVGADDYWKSLNFDMEVNAQATRTAMQEGLSGDAFKGRVAELAANPTEAMQAAARASAMQATFQETPGAIGKKLLELRQSAGLLGRIVVPFLKTPINIFRYAMERTPFAPMVGQWRADFAAGGARQQMAVARAAMGTSIFALTTDLAMQGHISGAGPSDPEERAALMRQGWHPYSVKIGNRWYSYNRLDPFGMTMGMAATMGEWLNTAPPGDEEVAAKADNAFAAAVTAISQSVINKTYMQGISGFISALQDPDRYANEWVQDLASGFMPAGPLMGAVERATDPETRLAPGLFDEWLTRIPGLSDKLPPRRDLWGEPIKRDSGFGAVFDALSPIGVSKEKESPIDKEFGRLRSWPQGIKFGTVSVDGVPIDMKRFPEIYSEWVRLAGNGLKDPAFGKGTKDRLDDLVTGKDPLSSLYAMKSDAGKADMIQDIIIAQRQRALREILNDPKNSAFRLYVADQRKKLQKLNAPMAVQ